jgi:hypothetical protein
MIRHGRNSIDMLTGPSLELHPLSLADPPHYATLCRRFLALFHLTLKSRPALSLLTNVRRVVRSAGFANQRQSQFMSVVSNVSYDQSHYTDWRDGPLAEKDSELFPKSECLQQDFCRRGNDLNELIQGLFQFCTVLSPDFGVADVDHDMHNRLDFWKHCHTLTNCD